MTSSLEAAFLHWWALLAADLPAPETEYRFHPTRRWRFDAAWPPQRVAVELSGGLWAYGAHTRPAGVQRDMQKHNAAVLCGWRVLAFSTDDIDTDPETCVDMVRQLLAHERAEFELRAVIALQQGTTEDLLASVTALAAKPPTWEEIRAEIKRREAAQAAAASPEPAKPVLYEGNGEVLYTTSGLIVLFDELPQGGPKDHQRVHLVVTAEGEQP